MLARGDLPVLRRLMETGAHGRLDSLQPLETSLLWTSLATGKVAETHGIFNALEPQADGYDARPTASTSRRCTAPE